MWRRIRSSGQPETHQRERRRGPASVPRFGHRCGGQTRRAPDLRHTVPTPTAIVSTSPGKYQVLWRVEGFAFEQQERTLKLLAITFGGDPACTDCNRVLRLPGFLNQKYDPAHLVSVEYLQRFHFESRRLSPRLLRPQNGIAVTGCQSGPKGQRESIQFRARLGMDSARISPRKRCRKADPSSGRTTFGQSQSPLLRATNSRCCIGTAVAYGRRSDGGRRHDASGSPPLRDSKFALLCPSA